MLRENYQIARVRGHLKNTFLQEKAAETAKQKGEKSKPEEQEGMPQRQHCAPAKRCSDRRPKYHEEH
jgi:hypothetical protein